jgi:hypothetical protein
VFVLNSPNNPRLSKKEVLIAEGDTVEAVVTQLARNAGRDEKLCRLWIQSQRAALSPAPTSPIPASPTASPQGPTARAFDRLLEKHLMFSDPSLSLVPGEYVLLDFADDSGEFGHSAPPDDDDAPEDSMDVDTPPTSSRSDEVVADKDKRKQVRSARPPRPNAPF